MSKDILSGFCVNCVEVIDCHFFLFLLLFYKMFFSSHLRIRGP